ncbi:MAG: hypothetical protein HY293_13645 [Planctomycetes bacterium]|nr:hypothetical protein [Planctomycetota bacterium]
MNTFLLGLGLAFFAQEPPPPEGAVARLGTSRLRHYSGIHSVFYTPDGSRILSIGSDFAGGRFFDKTLRVWDTATLQPLCEFKGHGAPISSLSFSPDSRRLASAGADGLVFVWDLAQPAPASCDLWKALAGHDGLEAHRAFSALAAAPGTTIPLLRKELSTDPAGGLDRPTGLIKNLDDDAPAVRDQALRELELYDGGVALETLHEALKSASPEARKRLARR